MATTEYLKDGTTFVLPEGFGERKGELLAQFNAPGDRVAGRLQRIESVKMKDGRTVGAASVLSNDGNLVKFFLGNDLSQKIFAADVGKDVLVVYDHNEATEKENERKVYRVYIRNPAPRSQTNPEITDDDIPF